MTQAGGIALEVVDVLGTGGEVSELLAGTGGDAGGAVVVLALEAGEPDPAKRWVVEGSVGVIGALGRLVAADGNGAARRPVVLLAWIADGAGDPAAEAAVEALRGIAQAATREDSTASLRVNVVAGGPAQSADVARTVAFLTSAAGGFVAGSTFDLREAR
jgi:hypothetical protein